LKPLKRRSKSPRAVAKARAWKTFSEYIRRREADKFGYVYCVTCYSQMHWKRIQAGHFIGGRNLSILFEEDGCHPQCRGCNVFGRGKQKEYYMFMRARYGLKRIDELYDQARGIKKMSISDFKEIEDEYRDKLVALDVKCEVIDE
jgi:hypothetical protein